MAALASMMKQVSVAFATEVTPLEHHRARTTLLRMANERFMRRQACRHERLTTMPR